MVSYSTKKAKSNVLAADHLVALVRSSQNLHGRLDDTTTEATEAEVKSGSLLDSSLLHGALIFELLSTEHDAHLLSNHLI